MSSGYIPFVSRKMHCRKLDSEVSKRLATPGRYHTGSIAAFVITSCELDFSIFPSGWSRPSRTASWISGKSICARVTTKKWEIDSCDWRNPHPQSSDECHSLLQNAQEKLRERNDRTDPLLQSEKRLKYGYKDGILTLSGSDQDGCGPILAAGVVWRRSGIEFYNINIHSCSAKTAS